MQRHNGTAWEDLTQAGFLAWLTARLAISGGSSGYLDGSAANGKLWVSTSTGTTVDVSDWLSYNATTGALSFAEKNIDLSQKLTKNDATKTLSVSHDGGSVDLSSWIGGRYRGGSSGNSALISGGPAVGLVSWDSTKGHMLFIDPWTDITLTVQPGSTTYLAPGVHPTANNLQSWHVLELIPL